MSHETRKNLAAKATAPSLPLLECRDISKDFGGVTVLNRVSLELEPGTITALAGENGAGKSTLMKIASGQYKPESGEVLVRGEMLPTGNAQAAHHMGVSIVPQELATIPDLKVYENIFVGRELRGPFGLKRKEMINQAQKSLDNFGVNVSANAHMGSLAVGVRQIIEIIKATNIGAKVVLFDEPSSAIAGKELDQLMRVMRSLRDQGVALLFTTHKMEEIRQLADRVIVLRDGGLVMDEALASLADDDIVTAMIGRQLEDMFPDLPVPGDKALLELKDVQVEGTQTSVNLRVKAGEIVGLAGLVGAGRTELLETIAGVRKSESGTISVRGKPLRNGSVSNAIAANVALVPEDRKQSGAVMSMDVLDNGSLPRIGSFTWGGVLLQTKRRAAVQKATETVNLRSRGLNQELGTLSGGNQQKVVIGRWLTEPVDVLLLDEPTRGVDVGARSEIYRVITDLAARGMAVLMASSDMPEILSLSHRAFVMRGGELVAALDRADLAENDIQDTIFRHASGMLPAE